MLPLPLLFGSLLITCVNAVSLKFGDHVRVQQGLAWPRSILVAPGHEALLMLEVTLENEESCRIISPDGVSFDINSPPHNRFTRWKESCSLKIESIEEADTGRWSLIAAGDHHTVMGWTEIHVIDATVPSALEPITLVDGKSGAEVNLSDDNMYCLVAKPFSESTLVAGHCSVTLERTTRAVQGHWSVLMGVPGRVAEVSLSREVVVEAEHLDVGYVHDGGKLRVYCNILQTEKNITFCRFQRTSQSYGYNVMDGLSDGQHSYYGKGFLRRECGITVESPAAADFGTWRCTVGLSATEDGRPVAQPPMQALISVAPPATARSRVARDAQEGSRTMFVQEDGDLTVSCQEDFALRYCWFQHPNGSQFTPVPLLSEDQPFWYTGEGLAVGQCGITFAHVTRKDGGTWRCHMGHEQQVGVEATEAFEVRVTGALAASDKDIEASLGESVTLYCHTANGHRPLDYCRFLSPTFLGLNIDPSVTEESAILERYYFTAGRNMSAGDCSLTIRAVREDDIGNWTCAGFVNDDVLEASDVIRVFTSAEGAPRHRAGVIGGGIGVSLLAVVLVGYVLYKHGSKLIPRRRAQNPRSSDVIFLENQSSAVPSSRSSDSSASTIDGNVDPRPQS